MSRRRTRMAIECWSDIGCAASDLQSGFAPSEIQRALDYIATVNPEMFKWLHEELASLMQRRAASAEEPTS